MENDRGRSRRVGFWCKARLKHGPEELEGETIDIGLGGILLKAHRTLPTGLPVQVTLHLSPRIRPLDRVGLVVRVLGGNQTGIQLGQLAVAERERL